MSANKTAKITMSQADEIIDASEWAEQVEDYEKNRLGHVYTLTDGSAVVVKFDGTVEHKPAK